MCPHTSVLRWWVQFLTWGDKSFLFDKGINENNGVYAHNIMHAWHHCSADSPTSPGPVHVGSTKRTFNKCVENPFSVPKLSAHSMVYESLKYFTDSPCLLSISNRTPASAGCLWGLRGRCVPPPSGCVRQCVSSGVDTWTGQHSEGGEVWVVLEGRCGGSFPLLKVLDLYPVLQLVNINPSAPVALQHADVTSTHCILPFV